MSLFDDIDDAQFTSGSPAFGPQEGYAGVLLCASACDGYIGDEEGQTVNAILSQKKLFERLTPQKLSGMMDRLVGELKRGGPERLIEKSYPAVPPELRESLFANAVDITLADGTVEPEEKEFIDNLQRQLEVDEKRAKAIIQVMVYKNQG